MRTSSSPASVRTTPHVAFRLLNRAPGPRPEMTHGLSGCRGREASTCLAVGDNGTARAPVFVSGNRISSWFEVDVLPAQRQDFVASASGQHQQPEPCRCCRRDLALRLECC